MVINNNNKKHEILVLNQECNMQLIWMTNLTSQPGGENAKHVTLL